MQKIFRFHRGELNGFFISALCTFMNIFIEATGVVVELVYAMQAQWVLDMFVAKGVVPMRRSDIFNIGKIGGLFHQRTYAQSTLGMIWFSPSSRDQHPTHPERSERGLVRTDFEDFTFVRVEHDTYGNDINTEATKAKKATLRERGARLIGYVRDGVDLFDYAGDVIASAVEQTPPVGVAYSEWYGEKYLFVHGELTPFEKDMPLTVDIYKLLFEAIQKIRRRGINIAVLMEMTEFMGEGYMGNIDIVQKDWHYILYYSLDSSKVVYNRERRYLAWKTLIEMKFKEFTLVHV